MKKANKSLCVFLLGCLVPSFAWSQLVLESPPDGAEISSPPTFEWSPGDYQYFRFYSAFAYTGHDYVPLFLQWHPSTSLTMPLEWWQGIAVDVPNYWLVIGINIFTLDHEIVGPFTFTKLNPCDPDPCPSIRIGPKTVGVTDPESAFDGNPRSCAVIPWYWGEGGHHDFLHFVSHLGGQDVFAFGIKVRGMPYPAGSALTIEGEISPNNWVYIDAVSLIAPSVQTVC